MASEVQDASRTRSSAFSLIEFEELVSVALDINSDRFPDGTLALTFNPECHFPSNKNNNKALHSQQDDMYPPLDSIDFGRASCVPGLGCAPGCSSSGQLRFGSVPTITLTAPIPSSPSKSRLVLDKIKRGASAFVARTRTLSTPAKRVTISGRTPPPPLPTQSALNPRNTNYRPIPTVSISAAFKNNLQLRSTVSLVDLESFNNNSAYSLATNTADFYDDESDFVPYLPLACQYERAGLKSPSMPTLLPGSKPGNTGRAVTIAALARVPAAARTGVGTRSRCISNGNPPNRNSAHIESRRRTLSAATTSSATSASDSASPVTPRSVGFLATGRDVSSDQNGDVERDGASFLSLDSGDSGDERVDNGLGISGQSDGVFDEHNDPFAKGSVQIVRTKSRAKPSFQLYNPDLIIGPGSAGEPVVVSDARSYRNNNKVSHTNTSHDRHQHGATSDSTSTSLAVPRSRPPRNREQGKRGTPRSSPSPTPISRMKKTPVVFPLMPGETQEDRKREQEKMAKFEGVEEWTLCLGKRDVPGSAQPESDGEKETEEIDNDGEGGEEAEETRPKDEENDEEKSPKDRKVKISEKASISDGERGRRFMARRSIPQLRVSHFMESGAETSGEEGYFTGDDWTLQLPLYNVPQDPLLAQNERQIRKSTSHSPAGTSFPDEERRRAISCTSAAVPKFVATRFSLQTLPRSSLVVRPSIDELTLRDPGPEPSAPLPPVPSEAVAFPAQKQDKLTPPSSSSARLSYCSNGSADARASMISVTSMASRTTSSTTTVVPGQWQREQMEQMEQKAEWSRSSFASQHSEGPDESAILNQWGGDDSSPRERRLSAFSVRTISTARSSAEFVVDPREMPPPPSITRSARRSLIVAKIPLLFGREAEKRARTVSMGTFRRRNSGHDVADTPPKRSFSPLSNEWTNGLAEGERDKKRDSTLSMPSQWLSVASREGSVRSVQTAESGGSRRRVDRRMNGSVGSDLFDDGASGRSGTYYSARSSFSTFG